MDKIDKMIAEALSAEETDMLQGTEELGYFALGLSQFRGPLGWVTWVVMLVQAAMFIAGVWCAWQFFGATDMVVALKWGLSASTLMVMATVLKLSLMPQMQADRVIRAVKRLELLIAARD